MNIFQVFKNLKIQIRILFVLTLLINCDFLTKLNAQTSKDNHTGIWIDNNTWINGSSPGLNAISCEVTIDGFVQHYGDLNFSNGTLIVNDTLIIYNGSLVFDNLAGGGRDETLTDISIGSDGVLIVYGDVVTGNKVDLDTKGKIAVTGQLSAQGGNSTEYLDSGGEIFLYNPPIVKGGGSFEPLKCPTPSTSYHSGCNYGDSIDASFSSIAPLLGSGGFSISPSGSITLSCNDSVEIKTQTGADLYSWYKNGELIEEGTFNMTYQKEAGTYYIEITVGNYLWRTPGVSISINDKELPTIICPSNVNVCEGEPVNLGTPIVTDNCGIDYTTNDSPDKYELGTRIVTWEVFDKSGNSASCEQLVQISKSPESGDLHRKPNK